ncbi:MAG TPA: cytochrome c oxidase subunit II [Solirubrobacterales bacterium]|nr:cytochrome c oxidase subunit II [Solirubrobacterales bacterium]
MTPHSPGTDQIDTLLWIGFVAAAMIVVAINVALVYALRRSGAKRGAEPRPLEGGRRAQFRVAGALTAFAAVVFVLSIVFTEKASEAPASGPAGLASAESEPLTIRATGQQWLWRYDYPNDAFSYYKLVVPVDTAVELELLSTDVVHTWDVPDLSGKRDAVPGKTNTVVFRADEEGTYEGQSATLSGQAYAAMRTAVEVVSPQAYEDFVKQQKADIETAQDRVVGLIADGKVP